MSSWQKLPIHHTNWYGFKHEAVYDMFNVVKYLGDAPVKGATVGIYLSQNPDRNKGHKNIVLLTDKWVSGMDFRDFRKEAIVDGVFCITCNYALYSPNRHGFITCDCGSVSIDGGKDYTNVGFIHREDYKHCTINLLTQRVKLDT